ncbi:MAG TPA: riboflavin synthase [Alphaproteobacteria bacterium]|nr:riboflavin synthase [Alphaproteobacteria bacterium]
MFTGIITDIGTVASVVKKDGGDTRIGIYTNFDLDQVDIGASIACAGCCLTVVQKIDDIFLVDVSGETISKTNIGSWEEGTKVNLERALKMGDELGGHIVSGHVDGLATLVSMKRENDSHRLVFDAPKDLAGFIAPKGSVTLDGISLTVNEVEGTQFGVNIIPHTWEKTTLGQIKEGDKVHLEIDMLARYMARMMEYKGK